MKILICMIFSYLCLNASLLNKSLFNDISLATYNNEYKNIKEYKLSEEKFKNFSVKLNLNKDFIAKSTYYLKIRCDVSKIIASNVFYQNSLQSLIIKIDKNSPSNIILYFAYEYKKDLDIRLSMHNNFTYEYIVKNEGILFGLAYGIMFCAFLYNIILYIYARQNIFLYYSLTQILLLSVIAIFVSLLGNNSISDNFQMLIDFLETLCVLFVILFSKEILNIKKMHKNINKLYSFLIYISIVDLIFILIFQESLLYEYLPRSLMALIFVLSGFASLLKGNKISIYYIIAWLVLFVSLYAAEEDLLPLEEIYILHIAFPMESLILSFALGYELKQNLKQKEENDKILIHQSKLASMGEMINNIAHQWRQPLTHLSYINMNLHLAQEDNDLTSEYLNTKLNESNNQIDFMSKTIDNFRDFYKTNKSKDIFSIREATIKAIDIIKPSLEHASISLELDVIKDKNIKAYENEYSQVILNLLTNAKDVLVQRNINNPKINIIINIENKKCVLYLQDNANGIKEKYIKKIFEPYFTTKEKSSGIGLYMSKIIIESHFKGEISVENTLEGACFRVEV